MYVIPFSPRKSVYVYVFYIDAADIGDSAVDDDYLFMIAVIDTSQEAGKTKREERFHFHACFYHLLEIFSVRFIASQSVVKQSYFDALFYLIDNLLF